MASWDYKNLTGIQMETGPISGFIALQGAGIISQNMSYWDTGDKSPSQSPHAIPIAGKSIIEQAKVSVAALRDLIGKSQQSQSSMLTIDIPDQIGKLAVLRDQGVLTQEEFEAKKKELLSRM